MKALYEGGRFVATWEWIEHELGRVLKRFNIDLDRHTTLAIHIEPEDDGYAKVHVFYTRSSEQEDRERLWSLVRFWNWVKGGARDG